jgi:hypothetical protein
MKGFEPLWGDKIVEDIFVPLGRNTNFTLTRPSRKAEFLGVTVCKLNEGDRQIPATAVSQA